MSDPEVTEPGRKIAQAYLNAVQTKPRGPDTVAGTRLELIEYLQRASFDVDLPIAEIRDVLIMARRQAIEEEDNFEYGAVDTIGVFLAQIAEQRQLIEPMRDVTNRRLLILLGRHAEETGSTLTEQMADANQRLADLRALNLAFGTTFGRETLWRITAAGERALDLAQKLLGPVSP